MATEETESLTITEFNGDTGQTIVRPLTAEELAQREIDAVEAAERLSELEAKTAARASALAKLADLGLTADEIAAL